MYSLGQCAHNRAASEVETSAPMTGEMGQGGRLRALAANGDHQGTYCILRICIRVSCARHGTHYASSVKHIHHEMDSCTTRSTSETGQLYSEADLHGMGAKGAMVLNDAW